MSGEVRYPRGVRPGDLVAVIAPSSGVREPMHGRLDAAIARLRGAGLRVREGRSLRTQARGESAPAAQRADELMAALRDPEVRAVLPPWGGERAIELLRRVDLASLADVEPTWLCGFSDLSTIQVPLLLQAGWASLHGPNLMQLADAALDPCSARVLDAWACGPGDVLRQASSEGSAWRRLDGGASPVEMRGRLVGGCLDSISRLAGSPHGDLRSFAARNLEDGVIVFLENAELKPFELARALHGLRLAGWFDDVAGVLVGRDATAASPVADFGVDDAMRSALGDLGVPVLVDADVGHVPPQVTLVQGARAELRWHDGLVDLVQILA